MKPLDTRMMDGRSLALWLSLARVAYGDGAPESKRPDAGVGGSEE